MGENPSNGKSVGVKLELNDIRKTAELLGLDKTTGIEINIPSESSGNIPSTEKKLEVTKTLLKKYLEENLNKYLKEKTKKSKTDFNKDIEEIVKLADRPKSISRDDLIKMLDKMGYKPEEILEGERAGLSDNIKYTFLNQAEWDITDMLNIVIGQGQNSYTPLQMNRVISTISNEGYLNKYTLIDKVTNHNSKDVLFKNQVERSKIEVKDPKHFEDIKYGALQAAQAFKFFKDLPIEVGEKTGTAEVEGKNPDGTPFDSYAWMLAFAPYDDPEIAVTVFMVQAGTSINCGPVVRDIVSKYFDIKINPEDQTLVVGKNAENNNQENAGGE